MLDYPGGPMQSHGSFEVEEEGRRRVGGGGAVWEVGIRTTENTKRCSIVGFKDGERDPRVKKHVSI